MGLTRLLYAFSFAVVDAICKFLLRKPSVRFAVLHVLQAAGRPKQTSNMGTKVEDGVSQRDATFSPSAEK
jgi:hypothetical protein